MGLRAFEAMQGWGCQVGAYPLVDMAKKFTPSILPNFDSFSKKKHKKWVNMEKFTPLAKILHYRRQWQHGQIPPVTGTFFD